ncbi:MAG: type I-E CRISPR-associated protein Cse2/CasB [Anaerolineales bacterium]
MSEAFIIYLQDLAQKEDRGALAALRRGLGQKPGTEAAMYPHVVRWVSADLRGWSEEIYYVVGSLFAWHSQSAPQGNLGHHLQGLAQGRKNSESIERRFTALLNAHVDDLPDQLRQIISLLKSGDVPVNWEQLMKDLRNWDHPDRYVQHQWARGFWGNRQPQIEETEQTPEKGE